MYIGPDALVAETATVGERCSVYGDAEVAENARLSGTANVRDRAVVTGYANVGGGACIEGAAYVGGHACVTGWAVIGGNARVTGGVISQGLIDGDAIIRSNSDFVQISYRGSVYTCFVVRDTAAPAGRKSFRCTSDIYSSKKIPPLVVEMFRLWESR